MHPYRGRALAAIIAVAVLVTSASIAGAIAWNKPRLPPTAISAVIMLLFWFWVITRTHTFAAPLRLRELIALARALPASARTDGPARMLLWTVTQSRRSTVISRIPAAALAEADADLEAGQSISTVPFELFSITPWTVSCQRGSYTLQHDETGEWEIGLPQAPPAVERLRQVLFTARAGGFAVTDADLTELAHQLRQARPLR
ncbi:hypothetical protein HS041_28145 [Planomonospora sp. ID67723]|uniref:hypothetical protein n=1 Tax=Planomonospora sp. ID67723 TaxID=2738134 RepID=UPI0018C365D6|nr:hypothetical protein [Planomonospora sp. ID67723]MBG0831607.1 hypothetical protein [Planomonospora sp. ID67723]